MKGDFPDGSGHSCLDLGSSLVSEVVLTPGRSFRLVTAVKFKILFVKEESDYDDTPQRLVVKWLKFTCPRGQMDVDWFPCCAVFAFHPTLG